MNPKYSVRAPHLSAIIAVSSRYDEPESVYKAYRDALRGGGRETEYIYILDGPNPSVDASLLALQNAGEPIFIVRLSQRFGESACLSAGFLHARAKHILILTPYLQVDPAGLPTLLTELDRADLVAAARDRHADSVINRLRGWGLRQVGKFAGSSLRDPGCLIRACKRQVLEDIPLHGEQHRFLPLLAERAGFVVSQIVLPQAVTDRRLRFYHASAYVGNTLDLISVAFLLKFTQKPFRFFGTVGLFAVLIGIVLGLYLVYQRAILGVTMSDRPLLLLTVLLVVLGIQIGAVGLIAEIIVFSRAHRAPIYRIRQVVERAPSETAAEGVAPSTAANERDSNP